MITRRTVQFSDAACEKMGIRPGDKVNVEVVTLPDGRKVIAFMKVEKKTKVA